MIKICERILVFLGLLVLAAVLISDNAVDGYNLKTVSASDDRIVWSPYNWHDAGGYKQTITAGSYIKVTFKGAHLGLKVKTDALSDQAKNSIRLKAYIDNEKPIERKLADAKSGELVFSNSLLSGTHQATIYTSLAVPDNRWRADSSNSLMVSGVVVERLAQAEVNDKKILVYGDSIVEQINTGAETGFAAQLGESLDAEYGTVGFGGQGWIGGGVVDRPLNDTWQYHFDRVKRDISSDAPDAIYNNMGINDANCGRAPETMQREILSWIKAARKSSSAETKIYMVLPFNFGSGKYEKYIQAYQGAVQDYQSAHLDDSQVYLIDLGKAGWEAVRDHSHDALHPDVAGSKKLAGLIFDETERVTVEPEPELKPEATLVLSRHEGFHLPLIFPVYLRSAIAWLCL